MFLKIPSFSLKGGGRNSRISKNALNIAESVKTAEYPAIRPPPSPPPPPSGERLAVSGGGNATGSGLVRCGAAGPVPGQPGSTRICDLAGRISTHFGPQFDTFWAPISASQPASQPAIQPKNNLWYLVCLGSLGSPPRRFNSGRAARVAKRQRAPKPATRNPKP
jgi:hypothetical protein